MYKNMGEKISLIFFVAFILFGLVLALKVFVPNLNQGRGLIEKVPLANKENFQQENLKQENLKLEKLQQEKLKAIKKINSQLEKVKTKEIQDEIVIKYRSTSELSKLKANLGEKGVNVKEIYNVKDEYGDGFQRGVIRVSKNDKVKEAVKYLNQVAGVEYAEPNYLYKAAYTPTDTHYEEQWPLQLMNAPSAWDITKGNSSTIVAVLDSGVDFKHPDLSGQMLASGFDYVNLDYNPVDDNGHGTMVAGIIAAKINGQGIVGVASGVKILPIKVLNRYGSGYSNHVASGIIYAVNKGAKIINLSIASPYFSQSVKDAINYAHSKGRIVIGASGNEGRNLTTYPAAYPYVIGVGASDSDDNVATFSNYGSYIDVVAPGQGILTTAPQYSTYLNMKDYANVNGTSFAAPHVSALAALVLSAYPGLSPDQVEGKIKTYAKDIGTPGSDVYSGKGRVELFQTLVDKYEPNNGLAFASNISIGRLTGACLVPAGEVDYYKYYLKKGFKFYFNVSSPSGTNIVVKIYNNQGELVKTENRFGEGKAESNYIRQSEDGYLYLRVSEYNNKPVRTNYYIRTSRLDGYENNNSQEKAYQVSNIPNTLNAAINGNIDTDWFKINVNNGGELKLNLNNYLKETGWRIDVSDSNNNLLLREESGSEYAGQSTYKFPSSGTYYIKIYNTSGENIEKDYSIDLSYTENGTLNPLNGIGG